MGPTASGKTALAIELTKTLPCEIISVDSALVYKGMNIGTAKPTAEELSEAPHQLIDIIEPTDSYDVAQFCDDAMRLIQQIHLRGNIPLLVGGTMMYFKALLEGLNELPPANKEIRAGIELLAAEQGWPAVHAELAKVDEKSAQRLKPTDSQRLQRALEVYRISGRPLSEWHEIKAQAPLNDSQFNILQFAISPQSRTVLHQRIAHRFEKMVGQGFLEEVIQLLAEYPQLTPTTPSMRAVGYRQAWEHIRGENDLAEFIERGVIATRQLAKRQMTWMRGWPNLTWLQTNESGGLVLEPKEYAEIPPAEVILARVKSV